VKSIRFVAPLLGVLSVGIYVVIAAWNEKSPELPAAIVIFIATFSLLGATRLVGLALTDQLEKMASRSEDDALSNLSPEDAVLLVIGGIALAWVSVQAMTESFVGILG
jgi:hypothetical protein